MKVCFPLIYTYIFYTRKKHFYKVLRAQNIKFNLFFSRYFSLFLSSLCWLAFTRELWKNVNYKKSKTTRRCILHTVITRVVPITDMPRRTKVTCYTLFTRPNSTLKTTDDFNHISDRFNGHKFFCGRVILISFKLSTNKNLWNYWFTRRHCLFEL